MKIKVAAPGCSRCQEIEKNVREACAQFNLAADISHVYDMKEFAKLGVLFTPAVIVDGKIAVSGKLPEARITEQTVFLLLRVSIDSPWQDICRK